MTATMAAAYQQRTTEAEYQQARMDMAARMIDGKLPDLPQEMHYVGCLIALALRNDYEVFSYLQDREARTDWVLSHLRPWAAACEARDNGDPYDGDRAAQIEALECALRRSMRETADMVASQGLEGYRSLATETEMEKTIRDCVEALGGRVWSVRDSRRFNVEDMPDLIAFVPRRGDQPGIVALLELKSDKRQTTKGQRHTIDLLADCTEVVTGIVRMVPREGELSMDDALKLLGAA